MPGINGVCYGNMGEFPLKLPEYNAVRKHCCNFFKNTQTHTHTHITGTRKCVDMAVQSPLNSLISPKQLYQLGCLI